MRGIQQQRRACNESIDYTIVAIEADEKSPLIKNGKKPVEKYGLSYSPNGGSFQSSGSSNQNGGRTSSFASTTYFKNHFMDFKVLIFLLLMSGAVSVAIYLLVIDSRLPFITLYLDLVSRDVWSFKTLTKHYPHLQPENVDLIVLTQTGNGNCDTSNECLKVLREMEKSEPEELPFNFLIGGDGHTYEVRGWKYQSGIIDVPQQQSLVIGVIGNFDQLPPKSNMLRSVKSLIQLSAKRQLINTNYYIYGLRHSHRESKEGLQFFDKVKNWAEFKGFLTSYAGDKKSGTHIKKLYLI